MPPGQAPGRPCLEIFANTVRWPLRLIWTIVAAAVFVVSLLGPAGGVGTSAKLGLAALHLTVAAVLIVGLPWAGRKAG